MDIKLPQKVINAISSTTWYHATTLESYHNIKEKNVIVDYNSGSELDFGYGFYLTTTAKLAENYISRLYKWQKNPDVSLVIMEYEATPLLWFQDSQYKCKIFPSFNDEFADFVFYNRTQNIYGNNQHEYDIIYGVMSDSTPTALILRYEAGEITKDDVISGLKKGNSMKQLSLHNQELCDLLVLKRAYIYDPETDVRKELENNE